MLLASLWAKNTQRGQQTFELQWSESTSVSDPIVHHDSYDHYSKGRQFLTSFICSFREMIAVFASFPPDLTRWHQLPSTLLQKSLSTVFSKILLNYGERDVFCFKDTSSWLWTCGFPSISSFLGCWLPFCGYWMQTEKNYHERPSMMCQLSDLPPFRKTTFK